MLTFDKALELHTEPYEPDVEGSKQSKDAVNYTDTSSSDTERCALCDMYENETCTAVAGDIDPQGWCELFAAEGDFAERDCTRVEMSLTDDPLVNAILQMPITEANINNPIVDRTKPTPYGAGGSVPLSDPTTFIDPSVPERMTVSGVIYDPADPWVVHENVEQRGMELLIAAGVPHELAYRFCHFCIANVAEDAWKEYHGIDPDEADRAETPILDAIQHTLIDAHNANSRLYLAPYPHDDEQDARHEKLQESPPTPEEIAECRGVLCSILAISDDAMGIHVESQDLEKAWSDEAREAAALARQSGATRSPVSVSVGDKNVTVELSPRSLASGDKLVMLDTPRFDQKFAQDKSFYIGAGGKAQGPFGEEVSGRYGRFQEFLSGNSRIQASEVGVQRDGRIGFINGRHRYAVLRDAGVGRIPVAMDRESIKWAMKHGYISTVRKLDASDAHVPTALGNQRRRKLKPQGHGMDKATSFKDIMISTAYFAPDERALRPAARRQYDHIDPVKQKPPRSHASRVTKDFTLSLRVAKQDADLQQIFGWASVCKIGNDHVIDKQGDIIPVEEIEKAAYEFVQFSRDMGEMHLRLGTGRMIESCIFSAEKAKCGIVAKNEDGQPVEGWWVGFHVIDPTTWAEMKAGKLLELSIGGRASYEDAA